MATILIIEDNRANMKLARFLLNSAGHEVIEADHAETGIASARTRRPDLILMDIQLPDMDGLEATRRLKSDDATREITIYAFTSFAMKGDRERVFEAGCDGYITKPISVEIFLKEIDGALRSD